MQSTEDSTLLPADGYYGEDDIENEEIDLAFLDEDTKDADEKPAE